MSSGERLVVALGAESLAADERLATNAGRLRAPRRGRGDPGADIPSRPVRWWEVLLGRNGIPSARLLDYPGLVNHPQVSADRMIATLDTSAGGTDGFLVVPVAVRRSTTLPVLQPPSTGAHTQEVLAEFAAAPPRAPGNEAGPRSAGGTLEGVRVVDLTAGVCGPLAGMLLAEMGGQVTKVEPPEGDPAATWGPPERDGPAPAYLDLNRAKTVIQVDAGTRRGTACARGHDRRGRRRRWTTTRPDCWPVPESTDRPSSGSSAWSIARSRDSAIAAPLADAPSSELIVQAMSTTFLGFGRLGEPPVRMGGDVSSATAAMHAVQGVLAALWRRYRTGMGQRVGVNMLQSALHVRGGIWTANKNPDQWLGFPVDHPTLPPAIGYRTQRLASDLQLPEDVRRGVREADGRLRHGGLS